MLNPIKYIVEQLEFARAMKDMDKYLKVKGFPVEQLMGFGGKPQQNLMSILGKLPSSYEHVALSFLNHDGFQGAVNRLTSTAATIPIRYIRRSTYDQDDASTWVESDSILAQSLKKVNPMSSPMRHMQDTLSHYILGGDAYWDFSVPGLAWNLKPHRTEVLTGSNGLPKRIKHTVGGKSEIIDAKDVCHFKTFHPTSDHYGAAPALSLALSLEADFYMQGYQRDFFRNDAMPRTILAIGKVWDRNKRLRFLKQWKKKHGGVGNSQGTALIENGDVQVHKLGDTMKESDFLGGRKSNRQAVKSLVGTPSAIMAEDTANYATAKQQVEIFTLMVVLPLLSLVLDQFNAWDRAETEDVIAVPDLWRHPLTRQVLLIRMKDAASLTKDGLITINEARKWTFLPPKPWGDEWHRPANLYGPDAGSAKKTETPKTKTIMVPGSMQIKAADDDDRQEYRQKLNRKFQTKSNRWTNKWVREFRPLFVKQRDRALGALPEALEEKNLDQIRTDLLAADKAVADAIAVDDLNAFRDANTTMEKASEEVTAILEAIFNLQGEVDVFAEAGADLYEELIDEFAADAILEAGSAELYDYQDPNVITFTENQKFKFATQVNSTTQNKLRSLLVEKLSESATIDEITAGVKNIFAEVDTARAWRARTIARTQVQGAANHGQIIGFKQAGAPEKEWVDSGDEDVRNSHAAMDGEVVSIDSRFSNGLKHPCDPDGSAEEVINCRCSMAPKIPTSAEDLS